MAENSTSGERLMTSQLASQVASIKPETSATTRIAQPVFALSARLDGGEDVLYVELQRPEGLLDSVLDDEEIFVFTDAASGSVARLAIPNYSAYWTKHLSHLADHLRQYVADPAILAPILIIISTTPATRLAR